MSHEHLHEQPMDEPTYTPEEAIAAGYRIIGNKVFERATVRDREDLVCVGKIGPRKKFQATELKGLTLRDHFAGQAIAGVMRLLPMPLSHSENAEYFERISDYAYRIADAMLERRNQT